MMLLLENDAPSLGGSFWVALLALALSALVHVTTTVAVASMHRMRDLPSGGWLLGEGAADVVYGLSTPLLLYLVEVPCGVLALLKLYDTVNPKYSRPLRYALGCCYYELQCGLTCHYRPFRNVYNCLNKKSAEATPGWMPFLRQYFTSPFLLYSLSFGFAALAFLVATPVLDMEGEEAETMTCLMFSIMAPFTIHYSPSIPIRLGSDSTMMFGTLSRLCSRWMAILLQIALIRLFMVSQDWQDFKDAFPLICFGIHKHEGPLTTESFKFQKAQNLILLRRHWIEELSPEVTQPHRENKCVHPARLCAHDPVPYG